MYRCFRDLTGDSRSVRPVAIRSVGRYRGDVGRRGIVTAAVVSGVLLGVAGCAGQATAGAGGGSATAPTSAANAPVAGSGAPNPNAPEVVAAGDIPDNQVFVPFSPPGGSFTVSVPQGWVQSAAPSPGGSATVFTDKFNSVRVDRAVRATTPDVASARAQDVPQLRGAVPGFVLGDVQSVQRSAGQAVLITYSATSAPSAVTGKSVTEAVERYTFWKGGTQVVLTLSGAKGSDNVDPWKMITDSFRWQG